MSRTRLAGEEQRRLPPTVDAFAIVETIEDGFCAFDRDWRFSFVNAAGEHILKRPRADLLGKVYWQEYPAALGTALESECRRAMDERTGANFEYRLAVQDRWFDIRAYPSADGGIFLYFRDITERKRAEEALRRSEALNRRILESSADCVKLLDRDGSLVFMNSFGLCEMKIDDFECVRGRSCVSLWPEESRPALEAALAEARAGRVGRVGAFRPTAKGTPKWWDVSVTPVLDPQGNIEQFVFLSHDVTDRKRADDALRRSEQRFRSVFEQSPVGKIVATEQQIREVNPAICAMLGYTAEELTRLTILDLIHPDERDDCLRYARALAADEISQFRLEKRFMHKSGEPLWVTVSVGPIRDAAGRTVASIGIVENIDARRKAEAALRLEKQRAEGAERKAVEATAQLVDAIETMSEGFVLFDAEDRVVLFNSKYTEIYAESADLVLPGARFEDMIREGVRRGQYAEAVGREDEWIAERLAAHRAARGGFEQELPNGRWVRIVERRTAGGGLVGVRIDVTELKRREQDLARWNAELEFRVRERTRELEEANARLVREIEDHRCTAAALQESEERLRASEALYSGIFRATLDGVFVVNVEPGPVFTVETVNPVIEEILGCRAGDCRGAPVRNVVPPAMADDLDTRFRRCLDTGAAVSTERQLHRDARVATWHTTLVPVRGEDGRIVRIVGSSRDITAQKEAEEALRRERQFTELLIESRTEGIVVIDTEFRHTVWNTGLEAMTGMPRSRVLGRRVTEAFPLIAGSPVEAGWRAALEGRTTPVEGRAFTVPETGRAGYYDATFAPLHGPDGAIIGAIAFVRETTERRRVEEQLQQAQKMEAVGQLAGGVAHDFNNLLTTVIGNLELAQARLSDETVRRMLASAFRSAQRGARLTQQLLAFSRKQHLRTEPVDVNALVSGSRDMLERTLGGLVRIETRLAPGLPPALVDPGQLELAVLNLAINGRDAMPDGGVVAIETASLAADDPDRPTDLDGRECVVVAVTDSGTGMDDAVMSRALEPFYTTKESGKGSGLGLAQVYGFAKQSGGTLRLSSRLGEGTRVEIFVPRADNPATVSRPRKEAFEPPSGGAGTVLLVDDEADVREFVAACLRELGYTTLEAESGSHALEILRHARRVDLLLADYAMPGMKGSALITAARSLQSDLPTVLVTGFADSLEGLPPDVPVLRKPFKKAELAALVNTALGFPARRVRAGKAGA